MYQSLPYYVFYLVLLVSFPWLECKPEDFVIYFRVFPSHGGIFGPIWYLPTLCVGGWTRALSVFAKNSTTEATVPTSPSITISEPNEKKLEESEHCRTDQAPTKHSPQPGGGETCTRPRVLMMKSPCRSYRNLPRRLCDSITNLPGILRVLGCGCQRQLMELRLRENYHMALW